MKTSLKASRNSTSGWTVKRQTLFLITLAETGSVTQAAETVGMSARAAYHLRMRAGNNAFRHAWAAAIGQAYMNLQSIAFDRAINGTTRQIWKDGELVAEQRIPSDRMLMWLIDSLQHRENIAPFMEQLPAFLPYLQDTQEESLPAPAPTAANTSATLQCDN